MFVELTKDAYNNFKPYLDKNRYQYNVCDVTLPKDSIEHIRIDFESVNPSQVKDLARQIDLAYGLSVSVTGGEKERAREAVERE